MAAGMRKRTKEIRAFVMSRVDERPSGLAQLVAETFSISRQAAAKHLRSLVGDGLLVASGSTKAREFRKVSVRCDFSYNTAGLDESTVWIQDVRPMLVGFSLGALSGLSYCVTEMVNNAIDHSGSPDVHLEVEVDQAGATVRIFDMGVGIFRKIALAEGLPDDRQAILELTKGKYTTDREQHSGEGIFFASRIADEFAITSHQLCFSCDAGENWLVGDPEWQDSEGTMIDFRIARDSTRTAKSVQDQFATPDAFDFARTIVPVRLASYEGAELISRSQAKRVVHRFESFKEVILDFDGVATIGQAFADQIFRVFQRANPQVHLSVANETSEVAQMIARALRKREEERAELG